MLRCALSMVSLRNNPLASVFLTVFVDLIGISIVIPVAAPLFLGTGGTLLGSGLSIHQRTIILGVLLGVAPIVQFFTASLWGAYSDRVGRKRVMMISILMTGVGHLLFGFGILTGHLWLLFASRFLAGTGAGNIAAVNSAIADVSTPESKARNFGLVGTAVGLGIIFGPFLGGKLSDASVVSWFNYATPLWFGAGLALLNALCIWIFFQETIREVRHLPMNALTGIHNLVRAFSTPHLRTLYAVSFLFGFGFNFFTQFFSVFLVAKFGFGTSQVGSLVAYVGIWLAFTQGILTRLVASKIRPMQVVRWAPLAAVTALLILARVQRAETTYWLLPIVAMSYGLNPPNVTALVSNAAGKDSQGQALGLGESMSALAFGLPPVLAALAITINVAMPLILAALCIFAAWIVFMRFHYRREPLFHEVS